MTWRNRNLFKKKAVPVQKFNMGGSVRGVEALKNVAPTIGTFDYDNAVNMMGGGMVDMPVQQMNMGGMPLEMFETGDPAINEQLNAQAAVDTMNQSLMTGGGDAVPQSMMAAPMAEEAPMMEDQGPKDMSAAKQFSDQALEEAKESSQDIIAQAMGEIEKEIDNVEEISMEEMKDLAELISMQQRRLDSASAELSNVMELGAVEEITLFDNEFEREVQKKYPLVTSALEKTLPKIMDTTQIEEETMPSDDTPVLTMQEGGDPADAKEKTDEQFKMELLERKRILEQEIRQLQQREERLRRMPTPRTEEANQIRDTDIPNKQKELLGIDQQIASGLVVRREAPAPDPTLEEIVKADVSGNLLDTNRRTYEDVLKQPGVQRIYSDLEKMIDQAGIGNVKDTKATGTQAATGVMRDVAAGEAGARLKKSQLELGLVGDIEGDPYGTKAGALTSTKLGLLSKGDTDNDKSFGAAAATGQTPFNWMLTTQVHVPQFVRDMANIRDTYETKPINGKERNFLSVFNEAVRDPKIRFFTTEDDGIIQNQRQNRFVEILATQFRQGFFDVERINAALESEFATKAAQYQE